MSFERSSFMPLLLVSFKRFICFFWDVCILVLVIIWIVMECKTIWEKRKEIVEKFVSMTTNLEYLSEHLSVSNLAEWLVCLAWNLLIASQVWVQTLFAAICNFFEQKNYQHCLGPSLSREWIQEWFCKLYGSRNNGIWNKFIFEQTRIVLVMEYLW